MRYRHLIFDLNGTIADTFADLTAALNQVLAHHGRSALDASQVRPWNGERLRSLLRLAFQATGPTLTDLEIAELLPEFRGAYSQHTGQHAQLYPGVIATLSGLQGLGVAMSVLTNKPLPPSQYLLEQLGIRSYFQNIVAGDGETPRKPDPAGLLQLIAVAAVPAEATLMVGSSRIDTETARNGGVRIALLDHDPQHRGLVRGMGADYVLPQMANLVALLSRPGTSEAPPVLDQSNS